VISCLSVQPKTIYTQGLPKHMIKTTKEEFFQKELQFIGQQEIYNKEVYLPHSSPDAIFGYNDRYDDYRRQESKVAGEFHDSGGLEHYHMARIFSGDPTLNASFVNSNPTDRIYASTSNDQLYVMANHSIQARRIVAKVGRPR